LLAGDALKDATQLTFTKARAGARGVCGGSVALRGSCVRGAARCQRNMITEKSARYRRTTLVVFCRRGKQPRGASIFHQAETVTKGVLFKRRTIQRARDFGEVIFAPRGAVEIRERALSQQLIE